MKRTIFLLASLFVTGVTFGQQDCEELQKENVHLKELVGFFSNPKETAANVEFSFFAAKGDVKAQTVTVEVLVKNISSVHTRLIVNNFDILDELNDSHRSSLARLGVDYASSYNDLLSDTPKKFTAVIEKVTPETFIFVKAVSFNFSTEEDIFAKHMVAVSGAKVDWK